MPQLHRNNAAEWIMVIALLPFVWMRRLFRRARTNDQPTPRPPRRVMIEGLPPRTMN